MMDENIIKVILINNDFLYEIEGICRLFFPNYSVQFEKYDKYYPENFNFLFISVDKTLKSGTMIEVSATINNIKDSRKDIVFDVASDRDLELKISKMLFCVLSSITKTKPDWGIVTGVRPVKLFRSLLKSKGKKYSHDYFSNRLLVNEDKILLTEEICKNQDKLIEFSGGNSFSLYISVPFCPSRCSYCSFVSQSVEKSMKLVPVYLDLLIREIVFTSEITKNLGLKLETVYIGGGTPTILEPFQIDVLFSSILESFDLKNCREITIEAGRPDTLTQEKLNLMATFPKIRISINPQTFNDDVLKVIGRHHTAADTLNAFEMAKKSNIDNINMDLIAGLPSDTYESFCRTIERTLSLNPKSITLHTLALKRASRIVKTSDSLYKNEKLVNKMLSKAYNSLSETGYFPYYLYRQSKMVSHKENTGWAKRGFECLYNVYMMDEIHSIIACGASAVTKINIANSEKIERVFNFKFPYEYINRFNEIIERKGRLEKIYEKF